MSPDFVLRGEMKMELWDGYNADKTLAGRDIVRGSEPPAALYHWVADVIVQHTDGTFLVMQRDPNKPLGGGMWEIGAGGSVLKGESPYDGAIRELREETGVRADRLILLAEQTEANNRHSGYNSHYSIYLCRTDMDKDAVTLQDGETVDFRWISAEQIIEERLIPRRSIELVDKMLYKRLIVTDRLILRPLEVTDLPTAHRYASDKEITRYMLNLPNDTEEETLKFITDAITEWNKEQPEYYEYAVTLDGYQIGGVCLYLTDDRKQGELGWILDREYHGKGYAFEAAQAMIDLAEQLGLESVFARCDSRNAPSDALMKRLGLTLESADGTRCYEKRGETAGELKYSRYL